MKWTADKVSTLTTLWSAGLSGREIGAQMEVSRGAVLGAVHRFNLEPRAARGVERSPWGGKITLRGGPRHYVKHVKHSASVERPQRQSPSLPPIVATSKPLPVPQVKAKPGPYVTLFERTGCAWPMNNDGPYLFCNAAIHGASSYCEEHYHMRCRRD